MDSNFWNFVHTYFRIIGKWTPVLRTVSVTIFCCHIIPMQLSDVYSPNKKLKSNQSDTFTPRGIKDYIFQHQIQIGTRILLRLHSSRWKTREENKCNLIYYPILLSVWLNGYCVDFALLDRVSYTPTKTRCYRHSVNFKFRNTDFCQFW